jgi:3-phenylpropionate/trans-cinnamate dioxygenase ferredoxin reductase subunit
VPKPTFVIVGASLAGAKAAETLRDEGFDGRVVLVGDETERPYERPPLSKEYLRGEAGREKIYVHEDGFYDDHDIELRLSTRVTKVERSDRKLILIGSESLSYERLLLATGAAPRRLSIPGSALEGVYYLRDVHDCDVIRDRILEGAHLVTVGAGWIGAEVAASARQKGAEVTILERSSVPLERVLGTEVGGIYRDIHVEHGVEIRPETEVAAFEGSQAVERVRTEDGGTIECDFVVVGVGVSPRTELAEAAALELDNGIVVNEFLETSVPGIFAAGDAANTWDRFYNRRIRVEHWDNAIKQGTAAAKNMLGKGIAYDHVPYFFSDQYDVGMEYSGYAADWDRVVFRGDPDSREFIAFWLDAGRVVAAMNMNVWDVTDPLQALIRSRLPIDVDRLADPDVPLVDLAKKSAL